VLRDGEMGETFQRLRDLVAPDPVADLLPLRPSGPQHALEEAGAHQVVPAEQEMVIQSDLGGHVPKREDQPLRDGVAWVRRPEFETWELIDEVGATVIPPVGSYLGVSSFTGPPC
jgi:hypothetical protein